MTYDFWQPGTTTACPNMQQFEYYDYTNLGNRSELGNDALSGNTNTDSLNLPAGMKLALQSTAVQNELAGTLQGQYPSDDPLYPNVKLSDVTTSATAAYGTYIAAQLTNAGCTGSGCPE